MVRRGVEVHPPDGFGVEPSPDGVLKFDEFCDAVKAAIVDEDEAADEYVRLATISESFAFSTFLPESESEWRGAAGHLVRIAGDERRHAGLLRGIFDRVCR